MIEDQAKKNGNSLNRELVRRLEQSFVQDQTAELIKDTARAAVQFFMTTQQAQKGG
jgi:hypothetical protein